MTCRGFVGEGGVQLATEYHSCDFDFDEHAAAVAPQLERQAAEAEVLNSEQWPSSQPISSREGCASTSTAHDGEQWEVFYQAHPRARFFKERRYLLLEFPLLSSPAARRVVELGCGCGSALLPLLRANPACATAIGVDVSPTCVQQMRAAAARLGIAPGRLQAHVADCASPSLAAQLEGVALGDAALLVFTLSAVEPAAAMAAMLANCYAALAPGGQLLVRDHGYGDLVQLRIPAQQRIGQNWYRRGDGTLAYFFTREDLASRAVAAGFEVQDCSYVCVVNKNRKTGQSLHRVFVHGVFRRPGACADEARTQSDGSGPAS